MSSRRLVFIWNTCPRTSHHQLRLGVNARTQRLVRTICDAKRLTRWNSSQNSSKSCDMNSPPLSHRHSDTLLLGRMSRYLDWNDLSAASTSTDDFDLRNATSAVRVALSTKQMAYLKFRLNLSILVQLCKFEHLYLK